MFNLMSIPGLSNLWSPRLGSFVHSSSMREVFTSPDFTEVGYYKSILDGAGIVSFIRNENANAQGLTGTSFYPSLCVLQDGDYAEAVRILKMSRAKDAKPGADWSCR
jgi:hypothetical protein